MESRNVAAHRAGHEAFNRRDFGAMVEKYAETIRWTDHARSITFRTPTEFEDDFLAGWIRASSDCRVTDARYIDAGATVVARFVATGTNDGPLGSFPPTGKTWALCPSARCGTSMPTVAWWEARSTTTRSRCSHSSSCCPSQRLA